MLKPYKTENIGLYFVSTGSCLVGLTRWVFLVDLIYEWKKMGMLVAWWNSWFFTQKPVCNRSLPYLHKWKLLKIGYSNWKTGSRICTVLSLWPLFEIHQQILCIPFPQICLVYRPVSLSSFPLLSYNAPTSVQLYFFSCFICESIFHSEQELSCKKKTFKSGYITARLISWRWILIELWKKYWSKIMVGRYMCKERRTPDSCVLDVHLWWCSDYSRCQMWCQRVTFRTLILNLCGLDCTKISTLSYRVLLWNREPGVEVVPNSGTRTKSSESCRKSNSPPGPISLSSQVVWEMSLQPMSSNSCRWSYRCLSFSVVEASGKRAVAQQGFLGESTGPLRE